MGDDVCFTNLYGTSNDAHYYWFRRFNGYYQKQYNQAMNNNLVMNSKEKSRTL